MGEPVHRFGALGRFRNCLNCGFQGSVFGLCFGDGVRTRRSAADPGAISCTVHLLLPLPSVYARQSLCSVFSREVQSSEVMFMFFLVHRLKPRKNEESVNVLCPSKPGTLDCLQRKLAAGFIISCSSELSWMSKELCLGVYITHHQERSEQITVQIKSNIVWRSDQTLSRLPSHIVG